MNDNAISRAIEHTHFAIVSAIAFCLTVITLSYLSLLSGIHIKKLKLGSIYAEQLYLKWDNALSVQIGTLSLPVNGESRQAFELEEVHRRLKQALRHADDPWIGALRIDRITAGDDLNGSLYYDPRSESRLSLRTKRYDLSVKLLPVRGNRAFLVDSKLYADDFNATLDAEGLIRLDSGDIYLSGDANVSNRIFLSMGVHAGQDALHFNTYSTRFFDSVAPIVQPLNLSKKTSQWIVDRAKGGPLMLHTLRTTLPYRAPAEAFDNLYARLTFRNAAYTFANDPDAFEPALAEEVEVLFKNKKLDIIPKAATFYGQSGGSTWLDIDFSRRDPVLDLYLDTSARLTPPLHRLTQSYGIDLPFLQTAGVTDVNLTLGINLHTGDTDASGRFRIGEGTVDFSGLPIDVNDTAFDLKGSEVTFRSLNASLFEGNVTASVTGTLDPAAEKGTLHFNVSKAQHALGSRTIALAASSAPLPFDYVLDPKQDRLRVGASRWRFGEHNLTVAAFDAPFEFGKLELSLPKTLVSYDSKAEAYFEGLVSLGTPSATLTMDLTRLQAGSLQSMQKHTHFRIKADENLSIKSNAASHWKVDDTAVTVSPFTVTRQKELLQLSRTAVTVKHQLLAIIEGTFDTATMETELNVSRLRLEDESLGKLFQTHEHFGVYIVPIEGEYDVIVPSLNMLYTTIAEGWKLQFFSLEAFKERAPLLDEYNLTQSGFTAWSEHGGYPVRFEGAVDYPYALTSFQNKPVSVYRFQGTMDSNATLKLTINDRIDVDVNGAVTIRSNGVAYSQPELTRFYNDHQFDADKNASSSYKPVFIDANDTAVIFADGRMAKADRIVIQYEKDHIISQLYKGSGGAMLEVKGKKFHLYGDRLDDDFMEHFFKFSKFKKGHLDFYAIGEANDFKGLIRISDTTVYDYVLLNNLFAFINTVPALVTFSLPSYESEGIKVHSAYAEFAYLDGNLTITGINVDSKELDFSGQGVLDYNTDRIKMELTVKTQAAENIRKIPLVGYILVGDDQSVLTTVNISGSIEDPKVENTIAKDIIVTPFNLLKRAFDFPMHYLKKLESAPDKKEKK